MYKEQLTRVDREKDELRNYKEEEVASFKVSYIMALFCVFFSNRSTLDCKQKVEPAQKRLRAEIGEEEE